MAAFRYSGLRNAGTPLEMASTPVMAVQPPENAASSKNHRLQTTVLGELRSKSL